MAERSKAGLSIGTKALTAPAEAQGTAPEPATPGPAGGVGVHR